MILDGNKAVIVCDGCGAEFNLVSGVIKARTIDIDGEQLLLRYFVCPLCDEIYAISLVDEAKYNGMVRDLLSVEKMMENAKLKGNMQMFDMLQKMALVKKHRIQNYVDSMKCRYNGTFTFVASENNQKEIRYLPRDVNVDKIKRRK